MPNTKLRRARRSRGWTQQELAAVARVSLRTVRYAEAGKPLGYPCRLAIATGLGDDERVLFPPT